jgi:soluble lytic murein transglycosylase
VEARAACFPRPHQAVVQKLALEGGLHPLLPYAIMNAESGLDPSVTSLAGARGLMQLMPALAGELATDIPGFHIDQLYHAGVNARLGTRELSLLQAKFARIAVQPSLPLVIASYNGGADSVDRWLQGYVAPPDIDLFSEEISYTETRRYVRRVLAFLISYQRAYAG